MIQCLSWSNNLRFKKLIVSDVFISYSPKDIEFAQRLYQELEARDHNLIGGLARGASAFSAMADCQIKAAGTANNGSRIGCIS